jgi:CheY-like chemotaxis protein
LRKLRASGKTSVRRPWRFMSQDQQLARGAVVVDDEDRGLRSLRRRLGQQPAHARHQLLGGKGLGHVVVGPGSMPRSASCAPPRAVSMSTRVAVRRVARIARQTSKPLRPGNMRSSSTRMRLEVAERARARPRRRARPGLEAGMAHEELQGSDDALLVLGDQDARGHAVVYLAALAVESCRGGKGWPRRVLIADDEPNIVTSLEYLMTKSGYEVAIARNGDEALALVESFTPDLVLLDVMMPRRSGYEVCQRMRERPEWGHIRS